MNAGPSWLNARTDTALKWVACGFLQVWLAVSLPGAPAAETNYPANETWESISNRWGVVAHAELEQKAEQGDASAQYFIAWACWDATNQTEAVKWFKLAAGKNLAAAQNRMGFMYHHGTGLETNYSEALKWYLLAAGQGYANAEFNLGQMYYNGTGTPQDYAAAAKYFKLAAEQGQAMAQDALGHALEHGEGVPQDYAVAARYYRLAADQGHPMAQNNLGCLYRAGNGVPQDVQEAMKWFQKSADQGEAYGQGNLGWMYEFGNGVEHNHELALKWTTAAAENGLAKSQLQLGDFLEMRFDAGKKWIPDHAGAMEWYRKAALQGEVEAMMKLGELYFHQNDYAEIVRWYGLAVTNGEAAAAVKLGDLYRVNRPDHPQNHPEAARWYRIAAEKDDAEAQYQLGCLLLDGQDFPHNPTEAEDWLRKSAENGYSQAALRLAGLHNLPSTSVLTNLSRTDLEASAFDGDGKTRLPLGIAFEEGIGGPKDFKFAANAYFWILNLGPREDVPEALRRLINLYATGNLKPEPMAQPAELQGMGTLAYYFEMAPKDTAQMAEFLRNWKGRISSPEVQYQVGEMFNKGVGVAVDQKQSLEWFTLAARAGHVEAKKRVEEIKASGK
jgi:TPR repeat protein